METSITTIYLKNGKKIEQFTKKITISKKTRMIYIDDYGRKVKIPFENVEQIIENL